MFCQCVEIEYEIATGGGLPWTAEEEVGKIVVQDAVESAWAVESPFLALERLLRPVMVKFAFSAGVPP